MCKFFHFTFQNMPTYGKERVFLFFPTSFQNQKFPKQSNSTKNFENDNQQNTFKLIFESKQIRRDLFFPKNKDKKHSEVY